MSSNHYNDFLYRLSRLHVSTRNELITVRTVNVRKFSVSTEILKQRKSLRINEVIFDLAEYRLSSISGGLLYFDFEEDSCWTVCALS